MCSTISLLNMKGGVGKTTLAVNLAWHIYLKERKNVLLLDLDPQFNATQYVMDYDDFDKHRKSSGTIADLLFDKPTLDLKLKKKVDKNPKLPIYNVRRSGKIRFDLLPSELDLAWVVKNPAQMEYRLEKILSEIRKDYEYIFIDCAPTDSVLTTMALTASNFLLVPVRPDRFSILGYTNLMQTIDTFRKHCPNPNKVADLGVVYTQVMGKSAVESECMDDIRAGAERQGGYVFSASLKYSQSFIRAVKDQTPIFQTLYARDTARNAASKIAKEMMSRIHELKLA